MIQLDVGGHDAVADLARATRYNPDEKKASELFAPGAVVKVSLVREPDDGPAQVELALGPQGAVVVIDPRRRDVLALVGGYEQGPGFNRALQAVRQPGSTFKPLVYAVGSPLPRIDPRDDDD